MFERFTASARGTVVRAQEEAADAGDHHVGTEHVVVALAQDDGVAGAVLRDAGVTAESLRRWLRQVPGDDESSGRLDADALQSIGIDLDDVRRSVEETFGAGALDDVPDRSGGRRWGRSKHIPFTARAKKSLELRAAPGDHARRHADRLGAPAARRSRRGQRSRGPDAARRGRGPGGLRASTVERSRRSA